MATHRPLIGLGGLMTGRALQAVCDCVMLTRNCSGTLLNRFELPFWKSSRVSATAYRPGLTELFRWSWQGFCRNNQSIDSPNFSLAEPNLLKVCFCMCVCNQNIEPTPSQWPCNHTLLSKTTLFLGYNGWHTMQVHLSDYSQQWG